MVCCIRLTAQHPRVPPFDYYLRSDEWTAKPHAHKVFGYLGIYVDHLLIADKRSLNDSLIAAVKQIWKTSTPEHLGPDPDCVPVLRFLGMGLERVDNVRSQELSLPEGTILVSQMEPSLQLKTRTTPGKQESFATRTKSSSRPPTPEEHATYIDALYALFQDELIETDATQKTPNVHYNSEFNLINIALRTRPDIAWPHPIPLTLPLNLKLKGGDPHTPTRDLSSSMNQMGKRGRWIR